MPPNPSPASMTAVPAWQQPRAARACKAPLFRFLVLAGVLNATAAFVTSARDCMQYSGVDLRCKVVAARALREGLDPYRYEWRPGMSPGLLDPMRRHPGPSRTTYPPTLLLMYVPLAGLPYSTQRVAWFLLEWAALAASLVLLAGIPRGRAGRMTFLAVGLFGFVAGDFWRFHVERGQFYVFVLLLLALGIRRLVRSKGDDGHAGIALGLAAALRPNFALMMIPLVVLGYRKTAVGMGAALALAIAATLPFVGGAGWESYFESMRDWERIAEQKGRFDFVGTYGPARPVPAEAEGVALTTALPIVTGGSTLLSNFEPVLSPLCRWMPGLGLIALGRWACLAYLLSVGALALALRRLRAGLSVRFVVSLMVVTAIDVELFLPQRYSYADILFLVPLALLIPALIRFERLSFAALCVVSGLVISRQRALLGAHTEIAQFLFLAGGLTGALLQVAAHRLGQGRPVRTSA